MKTKVPPPVWLVIAGVIMWFVARSGFAFPVVVPYALVFAILLAALGITLGVLAGRQFKSVGTTTNPLKPEEASALVRGGVFELSRNPMYLGSLLVLTGWGLWLGSPSNILVVMLYGLLIAELQIKPEELALTGLFGQEYADYCREVRRWC
jgi:protein-S-isoprenylcysteine O-methyltransferase Ste14